MAKREGIKAAVNFFKDVDDICQIVTGKRLRQLGARIIEAYGDDIGKKLEEALVGKEDELPADNPYRVLHCRPDADDLVIRGRYRLLVKQFHPDGMGEHPDPKEFQRITEAYNKIMEERHPRIVDDE